LVQVPKELEEILSNKDINNSVKNLQKIANSYPQAEKVQELLDKIRKLEEESQSVYSEIDQLKCRRISCSDLDQYIVEKGLTYLANLYS